MKRTMFQAMFVLGLGAGLGYLAAACGLDPLHHAVAASDPVARSPQPSATPRARPYCPPGTGRSGLILSTIAVVPGSAASVQASKKPNIVVIWGDDIGQSNVSAYSMGMMGYRTPNIDRVAKEGMI